MACERYINTIQELVDGTLGPLRRAELEAHLQQCEPCRRLAADLSRIHDLAGSLGPAAAPDHVWLQIAGRLRQEGRVAPPPARARVTRRLAPLALAASLLLIVGASLYLLYPRSGQPDERLATGNVAAGDPVQGYSAVDAELKLAEQHFQNAMVRLEDLAGAETADILRKNAQVINQAIDESRAALAQEPQNASARHSLFDAVRRKVVLLQDTIALMNLMRKGDAAGAAEIVEGGNKS
jgi:Putative zinc-finger